jgi:hypothetical protein
MTVFFVVVPFSLIEIDWSFRGMILIALMETVSTSEMLVSFYKNTRCTIPEDSHFHTSHHENLKSH